MSSGCPIIMSCGHPHGHADVQLKAVTSVCCTVCLCWLILGLSWNHKSRHRMLYSCNHMATVGVKWITRLYCAVFDHRACHRRMAWYRLSREGDHTCVLMSSLSAWNENTMFHRHLSISAWLLVISLQTTSQTSRKGKSWNFVPVSVSFNSN